MPAALTDYCRAGGVDLADQLNAQQVEKLLDDSAEFAEQRAKSMRMLAASERLRLSGLALLHAHAATHGKGCALADVRKGPLPNGTRDAAMCHIYRALTGDVESTDKYLVTKALELHRRRTSCRGSGALSGADRPSPGLRRSFAGLELRERSVHSFHVGGTERLTMEHKEGRTLLTKSRDMDIKGLVVGDTFLVKAPDPESGAPKWFRARVRGFAFRCGIPPVLITYIATEKGDTTPELLPRPIDSSCFKHQTAPLAAPPKSEPAQILDVSH